MVRGLATRGHHVTVCITDACAADRRLTPVRGLRSLAPWPPSRLDRDVELRVFPNVSNWLAYRQLFLPIGLSGYLKRQSRAFDVAHLHACRNLPGVIAARHLKSSRVPLRRFAERHRTEPGAATRGEAGVRRDLRQRHGRRGHSDCDDARRASSAHCHRDSGGTHLCRTEPAGARGVRPAPLPGTVPRAMAHRWPPRRLPGETDAEKTGAAAGARVRLPRHAGGNAGHRRQRHGRWSIQRAKSPASSAYSVESSSRD